MKKQFRTWFKIFLITFSLSSLIMGSTIIYNELETKKTNNKELYSYNIDQDLTYNVKIKPNEFINDEYLGMNESYITDLVENIAFKYKYRLTNTEKVNTKYKYYLTASINGTYQLNTESTKVWNKNYDLDESESDTTKTNDLMFIKNINIDLKPYINTANEFKKNLNISIDPYLIIKIKVEVTTENSEKPLSKTTTSEIKIPLLQQVFKIAPTYDKTTSGIAYEDLQDTNKLNTINLVFGILFIILAIISIVIYIMNHISTNKVNKYNQELDKILKKYGTVIIEINDKIDTVGYQIINVKNFNEMLDLEEELRIPINFIELSPNRLGEFSIVHENIVYKYYIDIDEL